MSRLAIEGGAPLRTAPMPAWPFMGDAEIEAVTAVLRSGKINYWTGQQCGLFEEEYAAALDRTHAIALANGTLALELALRAFDIGPGDEVVVPSRTFIATASSVVAVGATPIVADIDATSSNLTAQTVEAALTPNTRAVIAVHLGGWPVDMDPLMALAEQHDLVVIEDCAQAHGGSYKGMPLGSLGHAAAFSFCQDKIITTAGEGGLLALDDDAAFKRAWEYKDHGKSFAKTHEAVVATGEHFRWLHDSFGSNWRMSEVQAAVGRAALRTLPEWHTTRTRNALRLAAGLASCPGIEIPQPAPEAEHAFYRLYALANLDALRPEWSRDRLISAISAEGVPCMYGSSAEIYRERAFVEAGLGPVSRLPGARFVDERSVAFLVHPTMSPSDIDDTVAAVNKVMSVAARVAEKTA